MISLSAYQFTEALAELESRFELSENVSLNKWLGGRPVRRSSCLVYHVGMTGRHGKLAKAEPVRRSLGEGGKDVNVIDRLIRQLADKKMITTNKKFL